MSKIWRLRLNFSVCISSFYAIKQTGFTNLDRQHIRAQVCSAALSVLPPGVLKINIKLH